MNYNVPRWVQTCLWIVLILVAAVSAALTFLSITGKITLKEGYEKTLFTSLIVGLIGIVVALLKGMAAPGRKETKHTKQETIQKQLADFIGSATSSVVVFSNSFAWVDEPIQKILKEKAKKGIRVIFYIPHVNDFIRSVAANTSIQVREYPSLGIEPGVRFTLLDQDLGGSQRIAIGQGTPPTDFRITVFESGYDPQIVELTGLLVNVIDKHINFARTK